MSDEPMGMEDRILAAIVDSEKRLMSRLADNQERILNRLTAVEGEVRNLRSEHSATRDLVTRLPATVLGAIEKPLLTRMTDVENRVSKLEAPEG